MKDHVTVTGRSASVLRIQVNEQEMFDETLLEQAAFDPGCLKCRVVCRNPVVLEYDISGLMNIQAFLQEYTFVQREGYGFLEELFESSIRTAGASRCTWISGRCFVPGTETSSALLSCH